ncbi:hypothetical protein HAX54_022665 [Datura stramonium]|uniref:Uncharacterized protein n=1 Tax=Datura stramonium TaxID=4076 RepID=A0ABS8UX87_DATST|nr:hypothetical protein [Datura stramonium]
MVSSMLSTLSATRYSQLNKTVSVGARGLVAAGVIVACDAVKVVVVSTSMAEDSTSGIYPSPICAGIAPGVPSSGTSKNREAQDIDCCEPPLAIRFDSSQTLEMS